MEQITKASAKQLAKECEDALKAVAERHGLTVAYKGGRFTSSTFTPKLEFATPGNDREAFEREASWVGLEATDFNKVFVYLGESYKIMGINMRARRYPINVKRLSDGQSMKFTEQAVLRGLGR